MSQTQLELFQRATQIAEWKIREARTTQSYETKSMVKFAFRALAAKFYRINKSSRRTVEAQNS